MEIERLINELHDKGVLNLDTPIRNLIEPEGLREVGAETRGINLFCYTEFALVTQSEPGSGVTEIKSVADTVRGETELQ